MTADNVRDADLEFAHELADMAAGITLAGFGGRVSVELKADDSPVTALDGAAEAAIRAAVHSRFPGDGFCGEETGRKDSSSGRTWIVDPIDGTRMFAEGLPLWTTLIALHEGDQAQVAVADAPALGDRYHASAGTGAFMGEDRIHVSDVSSLSEAFVLHAALEEFAKGVGIDALERVVLSARASSGVGDALAHLLVARGSADALFEQGPCFVWDWAATNLIVAEAGGSLTQLDGSAPEPGCHLLVTNGKLADEMQSAIYPADSGGS
ncbi:MAG: inositol monophosphatase family protein [Candidatus Nanopelagicales bacterium]